MDSQRKIKPHLLIWSVILLLNTLRKDQATALKVSAGHTINTCPEGQNITLKCSLSGHLMYKHDMLANVWYFNHIKNKACTDRLHIRNISSKPQSHTENKGQGVYMGSDHRGVFWVTITNLSSADEGVYCCMVHEFHKSHDKHHLANHRSVHSMSEIKILHGNRSQQNCASYDFISGVSDEEVTTAVVLATVGCVIGILSLPLILLLIYKQRQGAAIRRRAHELVRMDSEARGVENPVFDELPGQHSEVKPRSLDISGRLHSESDRHLLSEPNTPLSPDPPIRYFPELDPVPEPQY
ncbi:V-type immunoglobulin domain-containing suppressor of T-cell activation [Callorhinchus milii]|uniref:Platelet receptor Gi24 n=1 Tax=Callorhinchus milii TaxID=7868 RepID=V9KSJ2_CALMI|nr:V-type immunoglobulin domain-containing suppressor of T-cell activation [Callorhinchus milii]|eukprot:gi/632936753/ref/XP_007895961.1/ PREDICTED: platelet receptor Gi24 [Callorhinchus milii]